MPSHPLAACSLASVLGLVLGVACTEDEPEIPEDCTEQPTLDVTNMTGNTIQVIYFVACDMSDQSEFPVPPPGLADGESISIPFPGPGCWRLNYEGDGCEAYEPIQTDPLDCDSMFEWLVDEDNHICTG